MVWIHGGAFTMGSASSEVYGPEYLIEHDIVLVTTNYRLGALGKLTYSYCRINTYNSNHNLIYSLWLYILS